MSFVLNPAHRNNRAYSTQNNQILIEIGTRLFERLSYMRLSPKYILNVNAGDGYFSKLLKKKYPKSQVVSVDVFPSLLRQSQGQQTWRTRWSNVVAAVKQLPFASESFDLVFMNQFFFDKHAQKAEIAELYRIMKPEGCLLFSTLGPDSFQEINGLSSTIHFPDMHDIGDDLLQTHFLDPVMDMEKVQVRYQTPLAGLSAIKVQRVGFYTAERPNHLGGRKKWLKTLAEQLDTLTYEIIYGHAWRGVLKQKTVGQETFIPLTALKKL